MSAKLPPRAADAAPAITLLKVDDSVRAGILAANTAGQPTYRKVIEEAFLGILDDEAEAYKAQKQVAVALFTPEAHTAALTFTTRILQSATRHNAQSADIVASLSSMGLGDALARDIAATVTTRRDALVLALERQAPAKPHVKGTRWRVDVTLSAEAASKVLRPHILLELTLSDDSIHTIQLPLEQFQSLRYAVAKMLTEMGTVESHPVLKIA